LRLVSLPEHVALIFILVLLRKLEAAIYRQLVVLGACNALVVCYIDRLAIKKWALKIWIIFSRLQLTLNMQPNHCKSLLLVPLAPNFLVGGFKRRGRSIGPCLKL
jgi:hypothetical protein